MAYKAIGPFKVRRGRSDYPEGIERARFTITDASGRRCEIERAVKINGHYPSIRVASINGKRVQFSVPYSGGEDVVVRVAKLPKACKR